MTTYDYLGRQDPVVLQIAVPYLGVWGAGHAELPIISFLGVKCAVLATREFGNQWDLGSKSLQILRVVLMRKSNDQLDENRYPPRKGSSLPTWLQDCSLNLCRRYRQCPEFDVTHRCCRIAYQKLCILYEDEVHTIIWFANNFFFQDMNP